MWSEAQIHHLVELIVEHGTDTASHWGKITAKHNQRFGLQRSDKALRMAYTRLKDCFTFVGYKKTWKLMKDNADLFSQPRRTQSGGQELKEARLSLLSSSGRWRR